MTASRYLEVIGLLLGVGGYLPYITSVLRRKTTPSLVTWSIWTIQGAAILSTYVGLRQWEGIAVPIVTVLGPMIVTILAWKRPRVALSTLDIVSITGTVGAGVVWAGSGSASWALYCLVATDVCGGLPTVAKTARAPESEDLLSWALFLTGNVMVTLSIRERNLNSMLYPTYLIVLCASIVSFSLRRFCDKSHR